MSGRSFRPLLVGGRQFRGGRFEEGRPWREEVLYEYFRDEQFPQQPTMLALRGRRYKLIRYRWPWIHDEFYDLKTDPGEQVNRIGSRKLRPRVREMDRRLFDRLRALGGTELAPWRPPERWEPGRNENPETEERSDDDGS